MTTTQTTPTTTATTTTTTTTMQTNHTIHNALEQVTVQTTRHTIAGFSISGLATYVQVPDLDAVFDLGECPLSAVPLRHVFLTHAHGDHSRCVLRHRALRGMLGIEGEATIFMPRTLVDPFLAVARAEARMEDVPDEEFTAPKIVGLDGVRDELVPLPHRKDLFVSAFPVKHRVPSLGYTLVERRRKLKAEHAGLAGPEIAALRKSGVEVSDVLDVPLVTFIGDCIGDSLLEEDHIWRSAVVILEATFVEPGEEAVAREKGHSHMSDIGRALRALLARGAALPEAIVLKHFSMKVTREQIDAALTREIPEAARDRVRLFL
jgi:ribonuclease Z